MADDEHAKHVKSAPRVKIMLAIDAGCPHEESRRVLSEAHAAISYFKSVDIAI